MPIVSKGRDFVFGQSMGDVAAFLGIDVDTRPKLSPAELVKKIDMKIIKGPYASYVSKEGNRGITGVVMIETSHIAVHIWDETSPALVQCDVYSCAEFSSNEVLSEFMDMEVTKINHIILNRAEEIKTIGG